MKKLDLKFQVFKKQLKNGLTVLVKPSKIVPIVDIQMWYNVGTKHEEIHEKGVAHFIEHMLFKGTKKLSESDIGLITQKFSGYSNAFTSHDYTSYVFRFPSNVWQVALPIFADCMKNAKFDNEMIASEIKAVVEEMRLYQDDYQSTLLESMIASAYPHHPYHYPIIGTKNTLCNLTQKNLLNFYKKYYHPSNATLVIVGDVDKNEAFELAEKTFSSIKNPKTTEMLPRPNYVDDFSSSTTKIFRDVQNSWCCYAFKVSGIQDGKTYLLDIVLQIIANGKSSRLYKKLVNEEKLATEVSSFMYDFFEHSLFCIGVYPQTGSDENSIEKIDKIVCDELQKFGEKVPLDWELELAKKRVQFDYASLLENSEKQAFLIGNYFLATQNEKFIENYINKTQTTTKKDITSAAKKYLNTLTMQKGYLLPIPEYDKKALVEIQTQSEKNDYEILKKYNRKTPVEDGKFVDKIHSAENVKFDYPKPKSFILKNGMEVLHHDNQNTPLISCILNFKSNFLHDPDRKNGLFNFMLRVMLNRTKTRSADELSQFLETNCISINTTPEIISLRCLKKDFKKALAILNEIITQPSFDSESVEKIRKHLCNEVTEYWDTPIDFVEQIAREANYQKHYYSKNPYGTIESLNNINKNDLEESYENLVSPQEAVFVVVGNLSGIDFKKTINTVFGAWHGQVIPEIKTVETPEYKTTNIVRSINRDQVVLAFVAPSISRSDEYFNHLALLDIAVTGGSLGSSISRLFKLREECGLFYTINGSLIYGARDEAGMTLIKTMVSADKVEIAKSMILKIIDNVGKYGITQDELDLAKKQLISSSVELFESNAQIASTFLFLKRFNLSLNLFDKLGDILAIIKLDDVNKVAKKFCNSKVFSTIVIGRDFKVSK